MRNGKHFGVFDCPAYIIPTLGASNTPANEDMRRKMMKGKGVSNKN